MDESSFTPVRLPASASTLAEGTALRFQAVLYGIQREAFVVRTPAGLRAYVNVCRHQSRPLDTGDGRVFDESAEALVCRHHGARYDPDTGICTDGPCRGARLTALVLEERPDGIWCTGPLR